MKSRMRENLTSGSVRGREGRQVWGAYTGTKLETVDTAKANLEPLSSPVYSTIIRKQGQTLNIDYRNANWMAQNPCK